MGDLIVTCTSMHSRNHRAGILIGQGVEPQEAVKQIGAVVEGFYAAKTARALAHKHGVEMPITEAAYSVLYEGMAPKEALISLMSRDKETRDRGRLAFLLNMTKRRERNQLVSLPFFFRGA